MTTRRADLDRQAYELRRQGFTFRAIGERLGTSPDMARRRVVRHARMLREQDKSATRPHSHRE